MKNLAKLLCGVFLIIGSIWLFAFSFHVWPWGPCFRWWYLPQVFTTLGAVFPVFIIGVGLIAAVVDI